MAVAVTTTVAAGAIQGAKARGAFYTPSALTTFLTRWAIRAPDDLVLEPACGDGAFLRAAAARFRDLGRNDVSDHIVAVELDPLEAAAAQQQTPGARVIVGDFFAVEPTALLPVDAVIGNPPYIRSHHFTGERRARGLARAREQGVVLSRLASSWAHFVAHSAAFVALHGRIALVLPGEILHTDYAAPVREMLARRFRSVVVVTIDRRAFAEADVNALLILASQDGPAGVRTVRVASAAGLADLDLGVSVLSTSTASERWGLALDSELSATYAALLGTPGTWRLGDVATVDIGVVTGANAFFVLEAAEARRRRLPASQLLPIIEGARDAPGLSVHPSRASRLVLVTGVPRSRALRRYLEEGVASGIAQGYKCRTRSPWYQVPLPSAKPHAFLPYMVHDALRLVVNRPRLWSTNLLHGVRVRRGGPDVRALSAVALSAAVRLSAELEGRSYGGGVLKLETQEAERLAFPAWDTKRQAALVAIFRTLDQLVRAGEMRRASRTVDRILGITHERYWEAAETLRRRRQLRGSVVRAG